MTVELEIIDHKGEAAIVFPDSLLKKLNMQEGDELLVIEAPDGLILRKK